MNQDFAASFAPFGAIQWTFFIIIILFVHMIYSWLSSEAAKAG